MGCSQSTKRSNQIVNLIVTDELENEFIVTSLVETEDKRIASANKSISIFSYNAKTKEWKRDINKMG